MKMACRSVIALTILVILSSCGQNSQEPSNLSKVLALPEISEQAVPRREWPDISLRKLFEVPVEAENWLNSPGAVKADAKNFLGIIVNS